MHKKRLSRFKDHFQESRLYLNRTLAATVMVGVLLCLLIGRLAFLQVYQHDLYKTLSLNNQMRIDPILPARGLIFDRNGVILADNVPAFSLEMTPERVENIEQTLDALQNIIPISDSERQRFYKQLKYKKKSEGIPIRIKLTEEEVAKFALEKYHFNGVDVVARLIRHYPMGEPLAHALGYIGPISEKDLETIDAAQYRGAYHIGKTGLEKYYEKDLHGSLGYQHIETDARGRTIRVLGRTPPKGGVNLHLSLDSELQMKAYEALGEFKGSVVALDPQTGEILALVSKPGFDPNLFAQGIDATTYRQWQTSPDRPLFNRAILGTYPPGSTIKPVIALKALDLGQITAKEGIFDPGWFQLAPGGRLYRDMIYHTTQRGHGWVDLEKALQCSCDTYFYQLAHKMGIAQLHNVFVSFGLGSPTGIDLPGEVSGNAPSAEWKKRTRKEDWYPGDTINIGIGQGMLLATPLQMAQMAAILATRGNRVTPHLVRGKSTTHEAPEPLRLEQESIVDLKTPEHWDTIIAAMQKVVHSPGGTAFRAHQGITYSVAGKTGTAQVFSMKQNEKYEVSKVKTHLRDHSWFIAFAPIANPKIAIAVIVENKHMKSGADVARVVLDAYFKSQPGKKTTNLPQETTNVSEAEHKAHEEHVEQHEEPDTIYLDTEE